MLKMLSLVDATLNWKQNCSKEFLGSHTDVAVIVNVDSFLNQKQTLLFVLYWTNCLSPGFWNFKSSNYIWIKCHEIRIFSF